MPDAAAPAKWPGASTVLALVAVALIYAPATLIEVLAYDRLAILSGQWWRLWSGHLVHFSISHALIDSLMLLLCGSVLEALIGTRRLCIALCWAAPLIALLLLLAVPGMTHYRGLSALDVMLATMALCALWRGHHLPRPWLALLAAVLLVKTASEALGIPSVTSSLPDGIRVMWQAHALGIACGLLEPLMRSLWQRSPSLKA